MIWEANSSNKRNLIVSLSIQNLYVRYLYSRLLIYFASHAIEHSVKTKYAKLLLHLYETAPFQEIKLKDSSKTHPFLGLQVAYLILIFCPQKHPNNFSRNIILLTSRDISYII